MARRKGREHFLSDGERKEVIARYQAGQEVTEIAKAIKRGWGSCKRALIDAGVYEGRKRNKTKAQKPKTTPPPTANGQKPGEGKKSAPPSKTQEEIAYLTWALKGAVNGWIERVVKDLASGKFT